MEYLLDAFRWYMDTFSWIAFIPASIALIALMTWLRDRKPKKEKRKYV